MGTQSVDTIQALGGQWISSRWTVDRHLADNGWVRSRQWVDSVRAFIGQWVDSVQACVDSG